VNDQLFAGYRLGTKLGEGAMGEVYQATAPNGVEVAIKILRAGVAGLDVERRFRREAMLCAALRHPHVVAVSDYGVHQGAPYFVMSLLRGSDLEQCVAEVGALRPEVAVAIILEACAGVRAAHESGIVHRDLKPANIFLHAKNQNELVAVVCDFGVAKVYDEDGALTASGSILGTPIYMAPEQLLDSKRVDARCDVWALGMVLYQALAGSAAFQDVRSVGDLILALNECRVPHLQDRAPWVPPALTRVVHAALLPLDRRIATIHELELALLRWSPAVGPLRPTDLVALDATRRANVATRANPPTHAGELTGQGDDTVVSDLPSDRAVPDLNLGRTLADRYRIVTRIGSGGMGAVYEAVDTLEGAESRVVAVKMMQQELGAGGLETIRRFLREAKASARIVSPHVTRFLDSGVDAASGSPFLVMERLRGKDLAALLATTGALDPGAGVALFLQACDALHAAHALGVVHRDIKPSNLFLHEQGDVVTLKVCDFGIAKQLVRAGSVETSTELTHTGGLLGSPLYMSPEQAKSAKNVDERSDVFSLALTMHEALSGERPWQGRSSMGEIIVAVCTEDVTPLAAVAPWVDPGLSAVIAKALARDVGQRYASIRELTAALERFGGRRQLRLQDLVGLAPVVRARGRSSPKLDRGKDTADAVSLTASKEARRGSRWLVAALVLVVAGVGGGVAMTNARKSPKDSVFGGASVPAVATTAEQVPPVSSSPVPSAPREGGSTAQDAVAPAPLAAAPSPTIRRLRPEAGAGPTPSPQPLATPAAPVNGGAAPVGRGVTATDLPL